MHKTMKCWSLWWYRHIGFSFLLSVLLGLQSPAAKGVGLLFPSQNHFTPSPKESSYKSPHIHLKTTSCSSILDSASCEDLKGVGSLNSTCVINSSLHLDDDLCLYGMGNIEVFQHVSITCPIKGCSFTVNVSGTVKIGPYAEIVAGSIVLGATNFTLHHHSTVSTTSLGGPPPAQTSGTPTGYEGAGGGHGGRGASCLKSNKTNWGGDVYAWSTLSYPWSHGSQGGSKSTEKQDGGDGGGRILLKVKDSLIVDGSICAEGGKGSLTGGGGSGGSIIVHALKL